MVKLTKSPKQQLVHWTKNSYRIICDDHFWPAGPEVVFFYAHFVKTLAVMLIAWPFLTVIFHIKVKISSADDIGVWFFGLKVCCFRRILLNIYNYIWVQRLPFATNLQPFDFTGFVVGKEVTSVIFSIMENCRVIRKDNHCLPKAKKACISHQYYENPKR